MQRKRMNAKFLFFSGIRLFNKIISAVLEEFVRISLSEHFLINHYRETRRKAGTHKIRNV